MRGTFLVESQAEYKMWLKKQTPQYALAMGGGNTKPAVTPGTSADSVKPATPADTTGANRTAKR
jgi:hypothetical protein